MKRIIAVIMTFVVLVTAAPVRATEIDDRIAEIQQQIKALKAELNNLKAQKASENTTTQHYEIDLSAGYYTIGMDIPVGTYHISSVSGSGNVYCRGGDLNEIFGGSYGIAEYNNFSAKQDAILSISSDVVIRLTSENANLGAMISRTVLESFNWVEAPAGVYTVGIDIPEGCYHVYALSGSGNAHVSDNGHNDGDLNEIFAVSRDYSGYITDFYNLYLYDGNELEITSDLLLRFDQVGE